MFAVSYFFIKIMVQSWISFSSYINPDTIVTEFYMTTIYYEILRNIFVCFMLLILLCKSKPDKKISFLPVTLQMFKWIFPI